jgi:hypothetical protein
MGVKVEGREKCNATVDSKSSGEAAANEARSKSFEQLPFSLLCLLVLLLIVFALLLLYEAESISIPFETSFLFSIL